MENEIQKIVGAGNRMLEIDLTTQRVKELQITDNDRRLYLGGKGLGLKLLFERLQPGIDPLGEDNYLAFMMGVLMGTGHRCTLFRSLRRLNQIAANRYHADLILRGTFRNGL